MHDIVLRKLLLCMRVACVKATVDNIRMKDSIVLSHRPIVRIHEATVIFTLNHESGVFPANTRIVCIFSRF